MLEIRPLVLITHYQAIFGVVQDECQESGDESSLDKVGSNLKICLGKFLEKDEKLIETLPIDSGTTDEVLGQVFNESYSC